MLVASGRARCARANAGSPLPCSPGRSTLNATNQTTGCSPVRLLVAPVLSRREILRLRGNRWLPRPLKVFPGSRHWAAIDVHERMNYTSGNVSGCQLAVINPFVAPRIFPQEGVLMSRPIWRDAQISFRIRGCRKLAGNQSRFHHNWSAPFELNENFCWSKPRPKSARFWS